MLLHSPRDRRETNMQASLLPNHETFETSVPVIGKVCELEVGMPKHLREKEPHLGICKATSSQQGEIGSRV